MPSVVATVEKSDPRRAEWLQVFGTATLPLVVADTVEVGEEAGGFVYLVNIGRLTAEQFRVFRHWCVDVGYRDHDVTRFISFGYAIPVEGVIVITSEKESAAA